MASHEGDAAPINILWRKFEILSYWLVYLRLAEKKTNVIFKSKV
jgi:hypothetical protein